MDIRVTDEKQWDVGVVVGRFQVDDLHAGHLELIQSVVDRHTKTLVIVGRSVLPNSYLNPLDVQSRMQMIQAAFPEVLLAYVNDCRSDEKWSASLDRIVAELIGPNQTAVIYGGRDSFTEVYSGRFDTLVLEPTHDTSGTARRTEVARVSKASADWRAGVIWASQNRYASPKPTVDVAIFRPDFSELVLGRKPGEDAWRLPGGFADVKSESYEADAIREVLEETGCKIHGLEYVRSFKQNDWRYRGERDCITTLLFIATTEDEPVAGDDLEEIVWRTTAGLGPTDIHPVISEHQVLAITAMAHVKRKGYLR